MLAWQFTATGVTFRRPTSNAVAWVVAAVLLEAAQGLAATDRVASPADAIASAVGAGAGQLAGRVKRPGGLVCAVPAILMLALGMTSGIRALRPQITDRLLDTAWSRARVEGGSSVPWPGAPGRVAFAIGLPGSDRPIVVLDATSPRALAVAPGVSSQGVRPGERGVVVVLGHRNRAFAALSALGVGDVITLETPAGVRILYVVGEREVVAWDRSGLTPHVDAEQLALVTCWPVEGRVKTPLRLVVRADCIRQRELAVPQRCV